MQSILQRGALGEQELGGFATRKHGQKYTIAAVCKIKPRTKHNHADTPKYNHARGFKRGRGLHQRQTRLKVVCGRATVCPEMGAHSSGSLHRWWHGSRARGVFLLVGRDMKGAEHEPPPRSPRMAPKRHLSTDYGGGWGGPILVLEPETTCVVGGEALQMGETRDLKCAPSRFET